MILDDILAHKRRQVEDLKARMPASQIERQAQAVERTSHSLRRSLQGTGRVGLIAEVKRASPSRGVIREDFDPVAIARSYQQACADAISVLTDERFFQGSLTYLEDIRVCVDLPLLRKEFIVDPYQVLEARVAGADAVLLIVAALTDAELGQLLVLTESLHMEALVEVHDRAELDRALVAGATLIGINNRDLRTFKTSLAVTFDLLEAVPDGVTIVSESGIHHFRDVQRLQAAGIDGMLVGEALMREQDLIEAVRRLRFGGLAS